MHQQWRVSGSSPRVRGTAPPPPAMRPPRFIPACAGNSHQQHLKKNHQPVHPRVCGEQKVLRPPFLPGRGSSPRVRGTAFRVVAATSFSRFIPACAGNRPGVAFGGAFAPVHPRVCGEQYALARLMDGTDGSSPRVRGTGWAFSWLFALGRFIPACAGNRVRRPPHPRTKPVHPRVCGEQCADEEAGHLSAGSSPRVRGTAVGVGPAIEADRFIPACAGNRKRSN